jgi:hypothetical protein
MKTRRLLVDLGLLLVFVVAPLLFALWVASR